MSRSLTTALFGLGFALVLCPFAHSQVASDASKCMGGGPDSKCGPADSSSDSSSGSSSSAPAASSSSAAEHDIRVVFDKDDEKGEIKCKKGKLRAGKIKYQQCTKDKFDKYGDVAVKKNIIAKMKFDEANRRKKTLAKKLAFYDSAHKALKEKLVDMGDAKKEEIEYKKAAGALEMVDKEFDKSLVDCAKDADFTCPTKN